MTLAVLKGLKDENNVTISSLPYAIGRCRSADFILAHVNVSRNHCEIVKENKKWKINDFSSSGTYVNDTLVGKGNSVIINNGDSIRFGPLESNLCWIFYSYDSFSENCNHSLEKAETRMVLDLYHKKSFPTEKNVFQQTVDNEKPLAEIKFSKQNSELKLSKRTSEVKSKKIQEKCETNNFKVTNQLQNIKDTSYSVEKDNSKEKNENEKIQELTKELQQAQNALNDLEKKNWALQGELKIGTMQNVGNFISSSLLENLTDLMEAEFQCTICSELFVTAVTLSCTHTFCKFCINQWKQKQKTCPICRKKIISENRSLVVDNYIDKMVGNLSLELKQRREALIKERNQTEPCKKKIKTQK